MDLGRLAGDQFGHRDAFFRGLVRQHRSAHAVADGPHAGRAGARLFVDFDLAALGQRDAAVGVEQALGVRAAPTADQQAVEHHLVLFAADLDRYPDLTLRDLGAEHFRAQADVEFLFAELAQRLLRDVGVGQRQEVGQGLEQRDLRAEPVPDRAEFQPDHAGADHAQRLRHGVEIQRAHVVDDVLAIEGDVRDRDRLRARGEDHVVGLQHDLVAAAGRGHGDPAVGAEAAAAVEERDLVALQQLRDAAGELLHHGVLALEHGRDVDARAFDRDAVRGVVVLQVVVMLAGVEQGLGRDAADVEAGAARRRLAVLAGELVDAGRLQAELRGADRGDVAAGAGADDDDVEFFAHFLIPCIRARAACAPGLPGRRAPRPGTAPSPCRR